MGRSGADDFASRNAATVTSYCYNPGRGRIELKVRMRSTDVEGGPAVAKAAASPGLTFASCTRRDDPIPTTTTVAVPTTPPPAPTTTVPASPAYPPATELRCSGAVLRFTVATDGTLSLVPPGLLAKVLIPRLVE